MQEVRICLDSVPKVKKFVDQMTKIKGNYVLDTGKERVAIETVREILEIHNSKALKLIFDSEDANFLLEISDYLQNAE